MVDNVKTEVIDNILIIKIDLKQEHGESKSGKTIRVASTIGFLPIETDIGDITLSLNCNKKKPKK